ncbi:expressed unknown protein [Seminavis robusta]|uniref:Uncharacterized protein n=1 Tax=Seminavis robusta TaxID=568900 RepID=A0A9N8E400_9STRA|nr:expressed unknown protein [Seminavis robusta]|eukprot:Sro501_g155390.1 n/a (110) ;mRNA; f:886-1215
MAPTDTNTPSSACSSARSLLATHASGSAAPTPLLNLMPDILSVPTPPTSTMTEEAPQPGQQHLQSLQTILGQVLDLLDDEMDLFSDDETDAPLPLVSSFQLNAPNSLPQ